MQGVHAHLLGFTHSKKHGTSFNCRRIELEPANRMEVLIKEISAGYSGTTKNRLLKYGDVREYDGTCNGTSIYRIIEDNADIQIDLDTLLKSVSESDSESNPFEVKAQAYILCGNMK